MTSGNIMIRTNCLQAFHALFSSKTHNLTSQLVGRLISALYEYRPDRSDFRQVLAWLTVMKQAHLKIFELDSNLCIMALPKYFEVCINDLWLSESIEVVSGASNSMKEILEECVKPICSEENSPIENHCIALRKVVSTMTAVLSAPFGATSTHILVIIAVAFEAMGKHLEEDLKEALKILGMRYDDGSAQRIHIEHAVFSAISTMDIEVVLDCIPLTDATGTVSVKRSWILPLLREGLHNANLEFFGQKIMKLAYQCYTKWQTFKQNEKKSEAHIYELLCCQLWGLFPGFCRKPKDLHNFKTIAKALGTVLNENPDLRPPVLDGFKELLSNLETEDEKAIFAKYAQNYMTRFFNIYTTKPATTYENEIRQSAFEVAKLYLAITPKEVLNSLFENAIKEMNSKSPGSFIYDTLFDIVEAMTLFQSQDKIEELFNNYIVNTLIKDKKEKKEENKKLKDQSLRRRLKKAYKLLQDILSSENPGCIDFISSNLENIEKILSTTTYKVVEGTQVMRLSCFNSLMDKKASISMKEKIVKIAMSEALASFNNEAVAKDGIAYNVLTTAAEVYDNAGKLGDFINEIMAGLVSDDQQLVSNTIIALKFIIQEFGLKLNVETVKFLLEQILEFVVSNKRNEASSSLQFLVVFVKTYPSDFVATFLGIIMKSINLMLPDTRRHSRLLLSFLLKKLCKKFTPEEVIQHVPGNDEMLHKKLRNIKKEINRAKRNRLESEKKKKSKDTEDSDEEELLNIQKKSMT
jgi:ribosomal RNA-processing protein 12